MDCGDGRVNADGQLNNNDDPEYFAFECFNPQETLKFLQESVESVTAALMVSDSDQAVRTCAKGTCLLYLPRYLLRRQSCCSASTIGP